MEEETEGAAEQHYPTNPRPDDSIDRGIDVRSGRRCHQPDHQRDGVSAQGNAGDPVTDGQDRSELRPIDLDVGRKWPRTVRWSTHHVPLLFFSSGTTFD